MDDLKETKVKKMKKDETKNKRGQKKRMTNCIFIMIISTISIIIAINDCQSPVAGHYC